MAQFVKNGGVWKRTGGVHVRDGGVWKPVNKALVKNGGVWKPFHYQTPLSYRSSQVIDVILSTYSFAGMDIGDPDENRYVYVCTQAHRGNGTLSVVSMTVAGQACSRVADGSNMVGCNEIWRTNSPVTSGSSATVEVTYNTTANGANIDVFSVTGMSPTPRDAESSFADPSPYAEMNISVDEGGFVIASAMHFYYAGGYPKPISTAVAGYSADGVATIRSTALNDDVTWTGMLKVSQGNISRNFAVNRHISWLTGVSIKPL